MASARAGLAVPQKILNLPSAKVFPSGGHTPTKCPAILFPGNSFHDKNRIFRELSGGSARLRWVSEYSKHRRPATRQRGIRSSSLEQSVPNFSEARMAAKDRSLEIVRDPARPAPAQSAEPPNGRGSWALCQFRRNPLVGFLRAHSRVSWRNDENGSLRPIGQGIDFVAAADCQRAPSEEEKWHIGAQARGNFDQSLERQLLLHQTQHADQRGRRIARPATEAAGHGYALGEPRTNAAAESALGANGVDRAVEEVLGAGRQCRVVDFKRDPGPGGHRELERIVERNRLKNCAHLVVAIRAAP